MKLYLDLETRSATSLRNYGVHRYVEDSHFAVMVCAWAIDEDDVRLWQPVRGEAMPRRLKAALENEDVTVVIANSFFDRTVINASDDFPITLHADRIVDTMVQALAHGLPGSLGDLSEIFGLDVEGVGKKKSGRVLIQQFCTPVRGSDPTRFNDWTTHPDDWLEFLDYARLDVVAMREAHKRMPQVNYPKLEHHLWVMDQEINDRGLPVDMALAEAAVREAADERQRLRKATQAQTGGNVDAATQRDAMLMHIAKEHDVWLPDMKADTLARLIEQPDLPPAVKSLIEIRQAASLTSPAKFRHVLARQVEGRLKGTMQMYGAARTGRDAGRVFQPQNLMRHTRWHGLDGDSLTAAIETDVQSVINGSASLVDSNVMDLLGNLVRGVIKAPEGRKLCIADLSNIEGRTLVWLAGEEWKVQYFRDFDSGKVRYDNYVMAYAKAMNVDPASVGRYERQIGKVMELGLGYGGGVAAFITFAEVYNLDLTELAKAVWDSAPPIAMKRCEDKHEWAKENGYHAGLEPFEYAACEYLKQQWRDAHPKTVEFWRDLEMAFRHCIEHDQSTVHVGRLAFRRQGHWLYVRLPSGRCLVYLQPKIQDGNCSFIGPDPYTKQIKRLKTYSGRLAENVTSATARDIMFHRMPDVEDAGYQIILRVHDELVTEVPDEPEYTAEGLAYMMTISHTWTDGLPLAADGFETYRYREG